MGEVYFLQPTKFPEHNIVFAENQPEYIPLPAHRTEGGTVISCWRLPLKERIKMLFSGKIFISSMTFNKPLQPLLVTTKFYKED
jgi:hypothetical protein